MLRSRLYVIVADVLIIISLITHCGFMHCTLACYHCTIETRTLQNFLALVLLLFLCLKFLIEMVCV